jgi:hypothetical protein
MMNRLSKSLIVFISLTTTVIYSFSSQQLGNIGEIGFAQEQNTDSGAKNNYYNGIKVIEKLGDWRNQESNIPYSEPVIIKDDFGSSEVMVFDRNYITNASYRLTVETQWTSEYITVYASIKRVQCGLFAIICTPVGEKEEKLIGNRLEVLIDGKSYTVYGSKGQFIVNDDLSKALFNASEKESKIRITIDENKYIDNAIGVGTVKAWKKVYKPIINENISKNIIISPSNQTFEKKEIETIVSQSIPSIVKINSKVGSGSGFIIGKEGYILTNRHIILKDKSPNISFYDGQEKTGEVISIDRKRDLALIKVNIKPNSYPALPMCITPKRQVGAEVIIIGNPSEVGGIKLTNSVSKGIISGFRSNEEQEMIQTDASINPGNSGGPMLNRTGHVIGIVNAKIINYGIEGIGFAIPLFDAIPSLGIKFTSDKNAKVDDCGIKITSSS